MKEISSAEFETQINDPLYLVDFSAVWCGPCAAVAPVLEQVAKEAGVPVYKVDVDEWGEVAARYGVRNVPTVVIMKGGKPIDQMVGSKSKAAYLEALNKHRA